MKTVLSIAGSDSSGGAGIQADIKTITCHGMYAMTVVTALTAQNTTGVYGVMDATKEFVEMEMDAVFTDIFPDGVKIGMLSNEGIISMVAKKLAQYAPKNIVLDPVMISTSGSPLLKAEAVECLVTKLMPLVSMITPNILEAQCLCGFSITTKKHMEEAALALSERFSGDILIKGGHLEGSSDDLLYSQGEVIWYPGERIPNPNNHGTGCTLSSSIACNLAAGKNAKDSVWEAKNYVTGALKAGLDLGRGSGPLNHGWNLG